MKIMIFILFILILVLFILPIVQHKEPTMKGGGDSSAIPHIEDNKEPFLGSLQKEYIGKSEGVSVYQNTSWTYRYLSKYYLALISGFIRDYMESQGEIVFSNKGVAEVPVGVIMTGKIVDTDVDKVLKYIDDRIGVGSFFLPAEYLVGIAGDGDKYATFILLKNTSRYPTKRFYSGPEATNMSDPLIILRFREGKLLDWGVKIQNIIWKDGKEKAVINNIDSVTGYDGYYNNIVFLRALDNKNDQLVDDETSIEKALRQREIDKKFDGQATCFRTNKYTGEIYTDNSVNKTECLTQSGIWDSPCVEDSNCSTRCNKDTGFCEGAVTFRN